MSDGFEKAKTTNNLGKEVSLFKSLTMQPMQGLNRFVHIIILYSDTCTRSGFTEFKFS